MSGCGFSICITPKYCTERIKWLTMGSLNNNRVSVDFLMSHILEKVVNCMLGYFHIAFLSLSTWRQKLTPRY